MRTARQLVIMQLVDQGNVVPTSWAEARKPKAPAQDYRPSMARVDDAWSKIAVAKQGGATSLRMSDNVTWHAAPPEVS